MKKENKLKNRLEKENNIIILRELRKIERRNERKNKREREYAFMF